MITGKLVAEKHVAIVHLPGFAIENVLVMPFHDKCLDEENMSLVLNSFDAKTGSMKG